MTKTDKAIILDVITFLIGKDIKHYTTFENGFIKACFIQVPYADTLNDEMVTELAQQGFEIQELFNRNGGLVDRKVTFTLTR